MVHDGGHENARDGCDGTHDSAVKMAIQKNDFPQSTVSHKQYVSRSRPTRTAFNLWQFMDATFDGPLEQYQRRTAAPATPPTLPHTAARLRLQRRTSHVCLNELNKRSKHLYQHFHAERVAAYSATPRSA